MQITAKELRMVLALLVPLIPKKTTLPILQNILVRGGEAHATDLEVWGSVRLEAAGGDSFLMPPLLLDTLRRIPDYTLLEVAQSPTGITVAGGAFKATYHNVGPKEYPPQPGFPIDDFFPEATAPGDRFIETLEAVLPYAATDDARPVIRSLLLHSTEQGVTVVGADGFRMGYKAIPVHLGAPAGHKAILPRDTVRKLARLWRGASERDMRDVVSIADLVKDTRPMRVTIIGNTHIQFNFGRVRLTSQLIQGTFPNYRQLIPTSHGEPVVCDAGALYRAASQVYDLARANGIVRFEWQPGGPLTIRGRAEEEGELSVEVEASTKGRGFIAYDGKYLVEALKGLEGELTMLTTTPSSPGLFQCEGAPDCLLMPMFVQHNAPPKDKEEDEAAKADQEDTERAAFQHLRESLGRIPTNEEMDAYLDREPSSEEPDGDEQLPESIGEDGTIAVPNPPAQKGKKSGRRKKAA